MATYAVGVCQNCGRPIDRVSHPDDPPPVMWVHGVTRLASCGLFAAPVGALAGTPAPGEREQ